MPETVAEPVVRPADEAVPNSHGETETPELKFESVPEAATETATSETAVAPPEVATSPEPEATLEAAATPEPTASQTVGGLEKAEATPLGHEKSPVAQDNRRIRGGGSTGHTGAIVVLVALVLIFGLSAAAYSLGFLDEIISLEWLQIKNITTLPEGLAVPEFTPIDPAGFSGVVIDDLIDVPDEIGFELPPLDPEKPEDIPVVPVNYYTQIPNVSMFFTRAMQDESYVYFLSFDGSYTKPGNLMRIPAAGGEPDIIQNANEKNLSIYSFTLFKSNIITCEYNSSTSMYEFYRVPKSFEDAQFLFEYDSPAFMNVHDNKVFMLFTDARKLGIYDPDVDLQPAFIDMPLTPEEQYIPAFSVMNGYIYYGISRNGGEETDYLRRSLYTGEVSAMLSSSSLGESWITSICWNDAGDVYYGQRNPETKTYSLKNMKRDASPETLYSFETDGSVLPLVTLDGGQLIAQVTGEILGRYNPDDMAASVETGIQDPPYAITKDFLIARDGYYRISDLSYTAFS